MTRRWLRFNLRTMLKVVAVGVTMALGYFAYQIYHTVHYVVPECYAEWWAADMVIEYMQKNHNCWPSNWQDLEEPYETLTQRAGRPWTMAQIRERVSIDFAADPRTLRAAHLRGSDPPFKAIWLRSGGHYHWVGAEPNRMIWDYLNETGPRAAGDRQP